MCIRDRVLHGHRHRALQSVIRIPGCDIPVFGIPSASAAGVLSNYPAEYNLYDVVRDGPAWRVRASARPFVPATRAFAGRAIASLPSRCPALP